MSCTRLLQQMIGVTLVVLLLAGCAAPTAEPVIKAPTGTATSILPTATPTPVQPTAIPTPSPSPTPVPGIEEPVVMKDMSIRVLEAYTDDNPYGGESTKHPDDPSHTFFVVVADFEGGADAWNRLASSIRLVYEGEEYEMVSGGIKLGEDGKFFGTMLVFSVPKDSNFAICTLQLTDEVGIGLAPFFE